MQHSTPASVQFLNLLQSMPLGIILQLDCLVSWFHVLYSISVMSALHIYIYLNLKSQHTANTECGTHQCLTKPIPNGLRCNISLVSVSACAFGLFSNARALASSVLGRHATDMYSYVSVCVCFSLCLCVCADVSASDSFESVSVSISVYLSAVVSLIMLVSECVCAFQNVHVRVCIHVCVHSDVFVYVCMCVFLCVRACTTLFEFVCLCLCMCRFQYLCLYLCVCVYVLVFIFVFVSLPMNVFLCL